MDQFVASGAPGVLRIREFRAMWAAEVASVLGDQLARVALAWLVFARTSSAMLTALTYALTFVPAVLGGAVLSGLADRCPRRCVLVAADVGRAVLAAVAALPGLPLPAVWATVGLLAAAGGPFKAAQLALLPQVLPAELYPTGLAVRQASSQIAQLAGFAAGGLLLTVADPHVLLAVDAGTFVLSAVVIRAEVHARPAPHRSVATPVGDEAGAAGESGGPPVRVGVLASLICLVGLYVVPEGLAAPYAHAVGMASSAVAVGVGVLMAADPIGSVAGAWLASHWRARPGIRSVVWLAVTAAVPLMACAARPGLAVSTLLWAVSGAASTMCLVQVQTVVTAVVPDHRRGGVMGRLATCLYTAQGVAVLAGGALASTMGVFRAVAVAGLAAAVLAGGIGVAWHTQQRRRAASQRGTDAVPQIAPTADSVIAGSVIADARPPGSAQGAKSPVGHETRTMADQRSLFATTGTSSQRTDGHDPAASPRRDGAARPGSPRDADPIMRTEASPQSGSDSPFRVSSRSPWPRWVRVPRRATWPAIRWALWTLPQAGVAYVLAVYAAAIAMTVALSLATWPASTEQIVRAGALVVLGVATAEVTRSAERLRRRSVDEAPHVNMSSVWTLAAALLTTPTLAAAITVILYLHLWGRSWRRLTGMYAYRVWFSVNGVVLACDTAAVAARWLPGGIDQAATRVSGMVGLVGIILAYWLVNSSLLAGAIALLRGGRSAATLWGSWQDNSLELATLCVGVVTAVVLPGQPGLVLLVPPVLAVLHRAVLVRQLERAATTDPATGLLTVATWHQLAKSELDRARDHGTSLAVLRIDIDRAGEVTDHLGAVASDPVVRGIAEAIRCRTRVEDVCGRLGPHEFGVLLPGADVGAGIAVARRIRDAVRALDPATLHDSGSVEDCRARPQVSIGVAGYPDAGPGIAELLLTADNALFAAHDHGGDQVRVVTLCASDQPPDTTSAARSERTSVTVRS